MKSMKGWYVNKIVISCRLNRLLGGEDELFCYRVYIHARLWGGIWLALETIINLVFRALRDEKNHVRMNYVYQRRKHGKAKKAKSK